VRQKTPGFPLLAFRHVESSIRHCPVTASGTDRENRIRYIIPPMFCPECRAEYRAGFTRCSDCGLDLVQELSESNTRVRKTKREWTPTPSTIKSMYRDCRKTVHWWALYKHQTGTWPWSSIAIHVINWVVILFGGGFLIWWTAEHHLSRWQFLGIFLLIGLPYGVVENWAKRRAKLNHLRNRKRLPKQLVRIEMSRNQRSVSYWAKSGLTFVAHQLMVTEGVSWLVTLGRIYVKKHSQASAWTLGRFRHNARNAFDIDQHTFLSNSSRCRSIPWMEILPSLGAPFDALGLDSAWPVTHVRCICNPEL